MSNFEPKSQFAIDGTHTYRGEVWRRILWTLLQCGGCQRGGLAKTHDGGQPEKAVLEEFFPYTIKTIRLPTAVPKDIEAEFREAELCVSVGANRAASALFRSTLEKTLKVNGYEDLAPSGYDKMKLQRKIDEAADEGIITESLRNRAHDEIRVLGNDVLHDTRVEIPDDDVEAAHHYTQRILEAFYDHRSSVEKILKAKQRVKDDEERAEDK